MLPLGARPEVSHEVWVDEVSARPRPVKLSVFLLSIGVLLFAAVILGITAAMLSASPVAIRALEFPWAPIAGVFTAVGLVTSIWLLDRHAHPWAASVVATVGWVLASLASSPIFVYLFRVGPAVYTGPYEIPAWAYVGQLTLAALCVALVPGLWGYRPWAWFVTVILPLANPLFSIGLVPVFYLVDARYAAVALLGMMPAIVAWLMLAHVARHFLPRHADRMPPAKRTA